VRLGVVTSHPIQYQAPLFRALAQQADIHVYFAHAPSPNDQAEAGFGVGFEWDTDVTGGYRHSFLRNVSSKPGIVRFDGCDTPDIGGTLAADRPDAIVVFGWHFKSYLQAARAARALGIPVLVRSDSHLDTPRTLVKRAVKLIVYPLFLRQFDAFLPTGVRAAAYLRQYGVSKARIRIVPYCIDVERFRRDAQTARPMREQHRANWGIAADELTVLYVGKLIGLKRIGDLIDALGALILRNYKVRLVLVGAGPEEQALREQAAVLNVPAVFVGFVNQSRLAEFYTAADLLVLPSGSETWGLVVNEAFACGVPAIVSDKVGCAPDMIREGVTGHVVPVGDSQRLANVIEKFAAKARDQSVIEALADMTEKYSPLKSAEALVAAAEASLAATRPRSVSKV
jgi:glycosyltransferase involved in cell wall biosynthesis